MLRYVVRRILSSIPVIIIVGVFAFFLIHMVPGNPAYLILGNEATPEQVAVLTAKLGLDQPLPIQFWRWATSCLRGDLGDSLFYNMSVTQVLTSKFEPTLIIVIYAMIVAMLTGIPLGIVSAIYRDRWPDRLCTGISMIGISMPGFLIGLFGVMIFAIELRMFPSVGYVPIKEAGFFTSVFWYLSLPSITLGFQRAASLTRVTRSSMLEVLKADFLRTASAKGVPSQTVIRKHALGNAWIPIITAAGASFCAQLAGSVVVESVFAWPGIGRMAAEAVFSRDTTTIMGTIILTTVLYVLVQMVVDILYAFIDPRIKSQYVNTKKQRRRVTA